jgi:hypothetical protein
MIVPANLVPIRAELGRVARTDPSPQVSRRAQYWLTWTDCSSMTRAAAMCLASVKSLQR